MPVTPAPLPRPRCLLTPHLHRVSAQQDELGGVPARLHAPDAAEADAPLPEAARGQHGADGHHPLQGDGLDGAVGVAAGRAVALHAGLGAQRVQVDTHDTADGVDGGYALTT